MIIYDAVNVGAIPSDATTILVYIDGFYQTYSAARQRFPNARLITITTNGRNPADICDVESGDATPATAAAGVRNGLYKTIYSDISNKGALDTACAGLDWDWFAADPTGNSHVVSGSIATQWAWPGHGSPGDYDISSTNGVWPNTPAPPPPHPDPTPVPVPTKETTQMNAYDPTTGGWWTVFEDGHVESYGGAPYLGGCNPGGHSQPITLGGPITGFCAAKDKNGEIGYLITATLPTALNGRFAQNYLFDRKGSAR